MNILRWRRCYDRHYTLRHAAIRRDHVRHTPHAMSLITSLFYAPYAVIIYARRYAPTPPAISAPDDFAYFTLFFTPRYFIAAAFESD